MRSRHPAVTGLLGLVVVVLLVALALNAGRLVSAVAGGGTYQAYFTDTGGLEVGDRVEVAGVDVGKVEDLTIERGEILATFTVDAQLQLGQDSRAAIKVGSLLGTKYLQVIPVGDGSLTQAIPSTRTAVPYDLTTAVGDLTTSVQDIDVTQLETSLRAISTTFKGARPDLRGALDGLSRISRVIADRQTELSGLLQSTATLSTTLAQRREDVATFLRQAGLLLTELDRRSAALRGLITHTRELSIELNGLITDNADQLRPALRDLNAVTDQLLRRQKDLGLTVAAVAKFARVFVNTVGGGPWFDSYLANAPDSFELEEPR